MKLGFLILAGVATAFHSSAVIEDALVLSGLQGRPGGRLVFAFRSEPKTFNPVSVQDTGTKEVVYRLHSDLIHINRETQRTEPALAKSWTVSSDGRRYTLELRRGIRFSDGHPFDADDVLFTFQSILDPAVHSLRRDLLVVDGKPIAVRKIDQYRVVFELPVPYAAAERLFDSFAILPRHKLEKAYRDGKLADAWGLQTPPSEVVGLGPFRLKQVVAGQRIVLEKNPYYWKTDKAGLRLPYLNEIELRNAGSEDTQVLRFQSGESDMLSRVSAKNYGALQRDQQRRGFLLQDAGASLEYSFVFFNLNPPAPSISSQVQQHQAFFRNRNFRLAVSAAVDRDAMSRLAYAGFASPLASPVPPGNKNWANQNLPRPVRNLQAAKDLLTAAGFKWDSSGALLTGEGQKVEFSLITSSSNSERMQMATLIQDDLRKIGMNVHVVPLEHRSLLDRVLKTHDYDACLLALVTPDADPNPDLNVWLSSGGTHLWAPEQKTPATPWEAEIDSLMRRQQVTRKYADRKKLYDRVQELLMAYQPLIPLVSPNILVAAKKDLGNFRPVVLDHYTLWNCEELYWRGAGAGSRP